MASLNSDTQTRYTESDNGLGTAKDSFFKSPELLAMTFSCLYDLEPNCLFNMALTCKDFLEEALDKIWEEMDSMLPLLKVLPALLVEDNKYVLSGNVSQADWDRLQYYSRRVKSMEIADFDDYKVHPSTYIRIAHLLSSSVTLFPSLRRVYCTMSESSSHIFLFLSPLLDSLDLYNIRGFENTIVGPFLATLSSSPQMLSRIVLRKGQMSADILEKSIVHFKQLRSIDLSVEVFMTDFSLWEVLGTLPSLADLTLMAIDPASHPAHAHENSNSRSVTVGPQYFDALESLSVTGSFFFIQHLLDFIDSPYLKSIKVYPIINNVFNEDDLGPDNLFTPSMKIVASKWSQSLKSLSIHATSNEFAHWDRYPIPKSLSLLTDLHEMQNFILCGWKMGNMDDYWRRMVMWWPKLGYLDLSANETTISLPTLRIIAENCPQLRRLSIQLDTSTIPPFDTSSKSLGHKLEVLNIWKSIIQPSLERQIQIARHLDLIFPCLEHIRVPPADATWSGILDLLEHFQDIRRGQ